MRTSFKNYVISATFKGDKVWKGNPKNHNNYLVTVRDTETGRSTRFDFWQSIARPRMESEKDLLFAFYCFISDAVAGAEGFDEFGRDFGFSEENWETWKACKRSTRKVERFTDCDMYDLLNDLSEYA